MRAILAGLLGLTLVGVGAATVGSVAQGLFIGEDADGKVVSFAVGAADHFTTCGGTAPAVADCDNGFHTPAAGPTSYLHGFLFPAVTNIPGPLGNVPVTTYTGSLVSMVSDGVDTRTFTCNAVGGMTVVNGSVVPGVIQCGGVGVKPSNTFHQLCFSNNPGNQVASTGPGGAGDWLCQVLGNNGFPAP